MVLMLIIFNNDSITPWPFWGEGRFSFDVGITSIIYLLQLQYKCKFNKSINISEIKNF